MLEGEAGSAAALAMRILVRMAPLYGADRLLPVTLSLLLLSVRAHAAGGLMLSASHNPIEWNALKFIGSSGLFLEKHEGEAMRALVESGIDYVKWDELGSVEEDAGAAMRHLEQVLALPYIDVDGIRARRFRVALDCVRGAGSVIVPQLLERLGCEVTGINMEPDGRFPREPEPTAENLKEFEAFVREQRVDIGFAVDPDVDRLARALRTIAAQP